MKKINLRFEFTRKKLIFFFSFIFFIYLLYLSIPSLYDTGRVQKDIVKKLNKDFSLNFSLSTDISYRILPQPHFIIKDCELIQLESNLSNRIAEIQNFKIFIKQNNFFNKEINIKNLQINNANFFLNAKNYKYIKKLLEEKFSTKKIKINKSKIFLKDENDEVVFIYTIKNMDLIFNENEIENNLVMNGQLFNIDNKFNWSKNFNTKNKNTKISAKKISFNFENKSIFKNEKYNYKNILEIQSNKFKTDYQINKKNISFSSDKSLIKNTIINYKGNLELDPFNFQLNINSKKLDLNYFFKNLKLLNEILVNKLIFKKNLYGVINIDSKNLPKAKIFDKAKIKINFQGGDVNLNKTLFTSEKMGTLELSEGQFVVDNNTLLYEGSSVLKINNIKYFYKLLLTPKKERLEIGSIKFRFQINPQNGIIKIKKINLFDVAKKPLNTKLSNKIMEEYTDQEFLYNNPILFKNFLNGFFKSFYEAG